MRQILLIISLLISLSSFAQDDFFWSYSHHIQTYDTIFVEQGNDVSLARFRTHSGDSLTITSVFGTMKVPSTGVNTTATNGVANTICKIITKHNDLYDLELLNAGGIFSINTDQIKSLKEIDVTDAALNPDFNENKILERVYINSSLSGGTASVDFSLNSFMKTFTINNESPLIAISLTDNPNLISINTAACEHLTTINLGTLNFNVTFYYGYACDYDQTNVDKILKWLVDGNNSPNETGIAASVSLCGGTNSSPSTTGMAYVSTLTSRGWSVCVNTSTATPTVQTNSATMISSTSATLNGSVVNEGSYSVTERGVCYGTSVNPTTSGTKVSSGSGLGSFSANATGLTQSTIYHIRAYAINSVGTSYGEDLTFTTTSTIQTQPELTTNAPTAISDTTAVSGGIITFDGNYEIIEKGVCWSLFPNPNTSNSKTIDGSGTASFTSNITGLLPNTTYYLRAYAKNRRDNGGTWVYVTGYGHEEIFTTASSEECSLPTVTTNSVNSITTNSASGGGNVSDDGNCEVIAKGLCWSTAMNPTITNSHTTYGSGLGAFSSSITGLSAGYTYFTRAYATNDSGTAYGNQISFTALCNLPIIAFYACSNPTISSVQVSAYISSDGGCVVTSRGFDYCTDGNFTTILGSVTVGSGIGSYDTTITGLQCNTRYYFRPWVTNSVGTCYGINCTDNVGTDCTTLSCPCPAISDIYQGGEVIYVYQSGDAGYVSGECHGIIAMQSDLSGFNTWLNAKNAVESSTLGGYTDWVLPAQFEINRIYIYKNLGYGSWSSYYWSSVEFDAANAFVIDMATGGYYADLKTNTYGVRGIRYF